MTRVAFPRAGPEVLERWRQQIAGQRKRRQLRGPRRLAAVGHLVRGPVADGLVDVRRLLFVVVHDQLRRNGATAIRVASYSAAVARWGLQIGGAGQIRFEKDLSLAPWDDGFGRRFNPAHHKILDLVLLLNRYLEQHTRYPHFPRLRQPRWPQFWAAFDAKTAPQIQSAGPEWQTIQRSADRLRRFGAVPRRTVAGLVAFPLEFVSHAWQQFAAVFADLKSVPKRQVIGLEHAEQSLQGFAGAIEFDLVSSRFSSACAHRPR